MDEVLDELKREFKKNLISEGDYWRILRASTIIDLIKLSFFHFQKERRKKFLYEVFNNAIRLIILSRIGTIRLTGRINDDLTKFNSDHEYIIETFDSIFANIKTKFSTKTGYSVYDLNDQVQYIKVINQLEIDDFSEDIFEQIIWITYSVLKDIAKQPGSTL